MMRWSDEAETARAWLADAARTADDADARAQATLLHAPAGGARADVVAAAWDQWCDRQRVAVPSEPAADTAPGAPPAVVWAALALVALALVAWRLGVL